MAIETTVTRKRQLDENFAGTVSEVFVALSLTLAFRRWSSATESYFGFLPAPGARYRHHVGSVLRVGRVVEIIRPVAVTLKEILHDPPCRVGITMRWRVDPVAQGCAVRLHAEYRLNHAAVLRARHWDRRLLLHFRNQFAFVDRNLRRLRDSEPTTRTAAASSGLMHD